MELEGFWLLSKVPHTARVSRALHEDYLLHIDRNLHSSDGWRTMDTKTLKEALSTISVLAYRASQEIVDHRSLREMEAAIKYMGREWDKSDTQWSLAHHLIDQARIYTFCHSDNRQPMPRGYEAIMGDCSTLSRYLDSLPNHEITGPA